jgi:isoleucyl-tRNA synthetase
MEDVEILTEDIPGWLVATEGNLTIALDINITPELKLEGIAREFINKIQNIRKESGFEVTDRIVLKINRHQQLNEAVEKHAAYISAQTLAARLEMVDDLDAESAKCVEIDAGVETLISVEKILQP